MNLDATDEGVVANILDATDEKATGLSLEVKKQHREKENINWPGIRDASNRLISQEEKLQTVFDPTLTGKKRKGLKRPN